MGRGEARIYTRIWDPEDDFVNLDEGPQRLYLLLISQPGLSLCGVMDLAPKRWAAMASNSTVRTITKNLDALVAANKLVIDTETEELWVRSYLKNDPGVFRSPNLFVGVANAYVAVSSLTIRQGLAHQITKGFAQGFPKGLPQGLTERLPEPFLRLLGQGFEEPPEEPLPQGSNACARAGVAPSSSAVTSSATPSPTPTSQAAPDTGSTAPTTTRQQDEDTYRAVLDLAAQRDRTNATDRGDTLRDPEAYERTCRTKRASQHGNELRQLIANHPTWTNERLLDILDGQPTSPVPDADETNNHLAQQRERNEALATRNNHADALIAALDPDARARLRARAEAEVPAIGGRRPDMLVTAAMRRLVHEPAANGSGS